MGEGIEAAEQALHNELDLNIDKTGSTYSIDRHFKIEKIINTLYRADRPAVQ